MMREKACKNKNLIHSSVLGLRCMLVFTQMSASDKEVRYFYFSNCSFQALNVRGRSEFLMAWISQERSERNNK